MRQLKAHKVTSIKTLESAKPEALAKITYACINVLEQSDPKKKGKAARQAVQLFNTYDRDAIRKDQALLASSPHNYSPEHLPKAPNRPARNDRPPLVPATQVPRRRLSTGTGRAALIHAVAHIEMNAIDLAFDMVIRFTPEIARRGLDLYGFLKDWLKVGGEESEHFALLSNRLEELGTFYGSMPAHDGLWEAAMNTSDKIIARLAIAPMVLEARGLDVTPNMIKKLGDHGDEKSAKALQRIYDDEIGHVAIGARWFKQICAQDKVESVDSFKQLVRERFQGQIKPPFNHQARQEAGIERAFYDEWITQITQ